MIKSFLEREDGGNRSYKMDFDFDFDIATVVLAVIATIVFAVIIINLYT